MRDIQKNWRRDEYRQRTGSRRIIAVEIVPENDSAAHRSSEDCLCIPSLDCESGIATLIHNAFDGREATEANNRERGN